MYARTVSESESENGDVRVLCPCGYLCSPGRRLPRHQRCDAPLDSSVHRRRVAAREAKFAIGRKSVASATSDDMILFGNNAVPCYVGEAE